MVAAGRPYRIRPQARRRFRSIHHPAGRDGPAQADELQGQRCTSGVVAGWTENYVLQHADGLQGRSAIHVRAATIWRPVRDAERRNAGRAADRQPVGRRRPELAGAEELTPGAEEIHAGVLLIDGTIPMSNARPPSTRFSKGPRLNDA